MASDKTQMRDTYHEYRKAGDTVDTELVTSMSPEELIEAGSFLGVVDESVDEFEYDELLNNKHLIEVAVHSDFATCEFECEGQTAIDRYCEGELWETERERSVAKALQQSYTSLFRVESTQPEANRLRLTDLLGQGESPLELFDLSLSESADEGALLFFRPVRLDELTMTSGFALPFEERLEDHLLEVYEQTMNKTESNENPKPESVRQFYVFHRLHEKYGSLPLLSR